jgi:Lipocalin-like domain
MMLAAQRDTWRISMRAAVLAFFAFAATAVEIQQPALGQQKTIKEQIVGTWSITSFEQTYPDGRKDQAFGATPKGVNTFDANGHFTLILIRPDLPKIASEDRAKLTPQESQAIAVGSLAYYGTYTVNELEKTLDLKLSGTTYTNQLVRPQRRTITVITADELRYRNSPPVSGGTIELVWKREK